MSFIEKGNEYGYDQILSGTGHKNIEMIVPIGKKVKRGDVVNASAELSNGTDLFGVVLEDADGTSNETKTTVVIFGEVVYENLNIKSGTDKATFIKEARNKGIIVKELGGKA